MRKIRRWEDRKEKSEIMTTRLFKGAYTIKEEYERLRKEHEAGLLQSTEKNRMITLKWCLELLGV